MIKYFIFGLKNVYLLGQITVNTYRQISVHSEQFYMLCNNNYVALMDKVNKIINNEKNYVEIITSVSVII